MEAVATKNIDTFIEQFGNPKSVLPENLVQKARLALENVDFPTRKTEAWKYTQVGKIARGKFSFQDASFDLPEVFASLNQRIVFVNGVYKAELSNISKTEGIKISTLNENHPDDLGADIVLEGEPFHVLNTLLCQGGNLIQVAAKKQMKHPIYMVHLTIGEGSMAVNRNYISAGAHSSSKFVQVFSDVKGNKTFTNTITEIHLDENAVLELDKVQNESEDNFHINTEQVTQAQNSRFNILTFTLNGGLVRNNLNIAVNGQNCETNLYGAYLGKGKQHIDNHTIVDHKVAHCESNELYKGVMDEKSTGVFNGKVFVRKDAQKINAFQSNNNVLLSDHATINSKPELEIYADDVKCSHGSTTGQMDEEAVFYLMARGISEKSARNLMVRAFIGELVDRLEDDFLVHYISDATEKRYGWGFKEEV